MTEDLILILHESKMLVVFRLMKREYQIIEQCYYENVMYEEIMQ